MHTRVHLPFPLLTTLALLMAVPSGLRSQQGSIFIRAGGTVQVRSAVQCCPSIGDKMDVFLNGALIFTGNMWEARLNNTILHQTDVPAGTELLVSIVYYRRDQSGQLTVPHGPYFPELSNPDALGAKVGPSTVFVRVPVEHYFIDNGRLTAVWINYVQADSSSHLDLPETGLPLEPLVFTPPFDGYFVGYFFPYDNRVRNEVWGHRGRDSLMIPLELLYTPDLFGQINFGPVSAGDSVTLSLVSRAPGTSGQQMFADIEWDGFDFWMAFFEDWYDLDFADVFAFGYFAEPAYRIIFDPPSAAPGDTVRMLVEPLMGDFPADVDFNILAGRSFATFRDTLGNSYGTDIYGRPLASSKQGLRIVIDTVTTEGEPLSVPTRVVVQMLEWGDVYYSGWGELKIEGAAELRIVDHAPWTIWPHLPPQSNGRSRGADRPGYDPKRSFTIEVRNSSGQPIINEEVEIKAEFVPFTGGHEHNSPSLQPNRQGTFYGQARSGNPVTGLMTDADGRVVIDSLIASQVSGVYLVTASLASNPEVKDTVHLSVRVPGLVPLPYGANYVLIGKFGEPGVTSRHVENHNGSENLNAKVSILAESVFNDSSYVLRINDVSLPSGGLFDINNNWSTPHSGHRVGVDVDIDDVDASGKPVNPKYFQEKVENPPFFARLVNEGNHFHITFR